MEWNGDAYQARFDRLAREGEDVHAEATLVRSFAPTTVLDAGCGTGRVAIELARHGITTTGIDNNASMLATARRLAPTLHWHQHDLTNLNLQRTYDIVVMAGNVPLFTPPGTQAALIHALARHIRPGGHLITGFSLNRGYTLTDYDTHCHTAGLTHHTRYATWHQTPYTGGDYAITIHHQPPTPDP
ncbi:class I SAM-dependent methyltransferase [Streptomyces sp. HNM0574]|uniref:class I SAM-dependent DNA methyltransferase n=1 Tax=Streptomyces sp. HNM0574 TaxID=2714954 RepID=UPI00146F76AA|nr:class I SAM-dependent methyltransferase [Streptomyces sp. HNM0574]NLU70449.1 class I SAM-dependent methyltransferase [Streptomyces sp. HNM0574]